MDEDKNDNPVPAPVPGTVEVRTKDGKTAWVVPIELTRLPAKVLRDEREDVDYAAVERAAFSALTSAVNRPDLTDSQKQQAHDGFSNLILGLRRNATWVIDAFYLGTVGRLSVEEVEQLRSRLHFKMSSKAGKKGSAARQAKWNWRPHATELAIEICEANRSLSNDDVALQVLDAWQVAKVKRRPKVGPLSKFVGSLRACGKLPERTKS